MVSALETPGRSTPPPTGKGYGAAVSNLFTDTEASKHEFTSIDKGTPDHIIFLANHQQSPPLSLFLPKSLERIRFDKDLEFKKIGHGDNANIKILDTSNFPDEDTLAAAQWLTCYNSFLNFVIQLAQGKGDAIIAGFSDHLNTMIEDPDFDDWFSAFRSFDKQIRGRFFRQAFIIDPHSQQWTMALQASKNHFMNDALKLNSMHVQLPASSGSSRYGSRPSQRPGPYDHSDQSFRISGVCLRCGAKGHQAAACSATNTSKHGRNFVVYWKDRSIFRLSDNTAVCIKFNLGTCTAPHSQSHPIHICSLCADRGHSASKCTRN
ncbi:hypothetical protein C8J56DRAFT_767342 [Mycena floridula]|nr:hypothetical protein C8J56DRAFT_767342 [Mycena floridula]